MMGAVGRRALFHVQARQQEDMAREVIPAAVRKNGQVATGTGFPRQLFTLLPPPSSITGPLTLTHHLHSPYRYTNSHTSDIRQPSFFYSAFGIARTMPAFNLT
jgi:hypothetical protein